MQDLTLWLQSADLSNVPRHGEPFAKGDKVTFTNDYGVTFKGHRVIGFAHATDDTLRTRRTVYIDYDCYWFPARVDSLTKEQ